MTRTEIVKKFLVLLFALALAIYSSIISMELLADVYTPVEDPDHAGSDRIHREKIMTRTINCVQGCSDQWGGFIRLSGSKQKIMEDPESNQPRQKARQSTLTAGFDRSFGQHLVGIALGTSNGDASLSQNGFVRSEIERDKQSVGMYYGVLLYDYINVTAQLLFSDYDYESVLSPAGLETDYAEYDAKGYSSGLGVSTFVPMKLRDFEFFVQPSISYLYVKTKTDPYKSLANRQFAKSELTSAEWRFALKWRKSIVVGNAYLVPMAGFSYNLLDREFRRNQLIEKRNRNFFEGLLGLTVQRSNLNLSASYQKTIGTDNYEREQYQVTFRVLF